MSFSIQQQICHISDEINQAATALAEDRKASAVLGAVMGDLRGKAMNAAAGSKMEGSDVTALVVEMQHAAESVEKAAMADPRMDPSNREMIIRVCEAASALPKPADDGTGASTGSRSPRQENL